MRRLGRLLSRPMNAAATIEWMQCKFHFIEKWGAKANRCGHWAKARLMARHSRKKRLIGNAKATNELVQCKGRWKTSQLDCPKFVSAMQKKSLKRWRLSWPKLTAWNVSNAMQILSNTGDVKLPKVFHWTQNSLKKEVPSWCWLFSVLQEKLDSEIWVVHQQLPYTCPSFYIHWKLP